MSEPIRESLTKSEMTPAAPSQPNVDKARPKPKAKPKKKKASGATLKGHSVISGKLIAAFGSIIVVLGKLAGYWHEPWMKWGAVPIGIGLLGYWVYGQVVHKFGKARSLTGAICTAATAGVFAVLLYRAYPAPKSAEMASSAPPQWWFKPRVRRRVNGLE